MCLKIGGNFIIKIDLFNFHFYYRSKLDYQDKCENALLASAILWVSSFFL